MMEKFNNEPSVIENFHTPSPLKQLITAYRICQQSMSLSDSNFETEELGKKDTRLIISEIDMGHTSPLEHIDFSFTIKCSRVTQLQLVRHRISSFSAESARACKIEEFFVPATKNLEAILIYKDIANICQKAYEQLLIIGEKKENARYILPTSMMSEIIYKTNLRSLRNAIGERTCKYAQNEIKFIFNKIKMIVMKVHPIFMYKVEKCYTCPNQCSGN